MSSYSPRKRRITNQLPVQHQAPEPVPVPIKWLHIHLVASHGPCCLSERPSQGTWPTSAGIRLISPIISIFSIHSFVGFFSLVKFGKRGAREEVNLLSETHTAALRNLVFVIVPSRHFGTCTCTKGFILFR